MKIKLTYSKSYDLDKLMPEIQSANGDHPVTLESIKEFMSDRFISPNFDKGGKLQLEIEGVNNA
jgi:hypothetical protein